MRQGDSYPIYISSSGLNLSDISLIEFTIGPYAKSYPGAVTYDSSTGLFSFPLSQSETLKLIGEQACEAKIKYSNSEVEVTNLGAIDVKPSLSRTVI